MSESTEAKEGAAVRFPPPFVPLIALAVGLLVHFLVWPWQLPIDGWLRYGGGALLVGLGLGAMAAAMGLFRAIGQDPAPWESTPAIVSTGIYGFTRNPMYLGMGLMQAGIGLALANGWVIALVPVTWVAVYLTAIHHEEAYLEEKFGAEYSDYKSRVRRWL